MAGSPSPSPEVAPGRRPRAERTRAAILEAAERLFSERGFSAARLEDVAAAVGIRRASLFYYFRDKADLYDEVLADVLGGLRERLEPILLGAGPLAARAEAAVAAWIDYIAARPALVRLLLREVADGGRAQLASHIRPFYDLVGRVLADPADPLVREARIDPVNLASAIAGSTVFFVAAMPILLPGLRFDPLEPEHLEAHRREVLGIARRLLGSAEP